MKIWSVSHNGNLKKNNCSLDQDKNPGLRLYALALNQLITSLSGSVGRVPAHRTYDPGSNPGPGEIFFFFKLTSNMIFYIQLEF